MLQCIMEATLTHFGLPQPTKAERDGDALYGDRFSPDEIATWFKNEEKGFFKLYNDIYKPDEEVPFEYLEADTFHFYDKLGDRHFDTCLALGCADGQDVSALAQRVNRYVAIEPAKDWWKDSIGGKPAEYRMPKPDGGIDLPDESVDLATSYGVLHHIPNVSLLIAEMARVLKPGGTMLLREPIVSMGDFTQPRVGLTAHERGIPWRLFEKMFAANGLKVRHRAFSRTNIYYTILSKLGVNVNARAVIRLDALISRVLSFNSRYWRRNALDKIGPSGIAYILEKA